MVVLGYDNYQYFNTRSGGSCIRRMRRSNHRNCMNRLTNNSQLGLDVVNALRLCSGENIPDPSKEFECDYHSHGVGEPCLLLD